MTTIEWEIIQRLDNFIIDWKTNCFNWQGSVTPRGYPNFQRRKGLRKPKNFPIHRLVYKYTFGKIPVNRVIDHTCGNTSCMNPQHLEAVPQVINVRRGKCPIINLEIANKIRVLFKSGKYTHANLAKMFSIKREVAGKIVRNQIWKEIE
jgi:hypothetical protein